MTAFGVRLRGALLTRRRALQRGAGIASPRRSDGYEFAELRGYVDGDDPRRIDWAATARAGAMQTRVVLEDAALVLAAAIDASPSMFVGRARTNYEAACAAAALWYEAASDDDRCYRIGATVVAQPGLRGRAAAHLCASAREPRATGLGTELALALAVLPRATRLLVASDFFEIASLGGTLRACAARFDVTALVVGDPWRGRFPLGGFLRLRDATTGAAARMYVDRRARERYAAAVARREAAVVRALHEFGMRAAVLAAGDDERQALALAVGLA